MKGNNQKVKRLQIVARIPKAGGREIRAGKMTDVAARLEIVFGNQVISDCDMRHLWAENRGEY